MPKKLDNGKKKILIIIVLILMISSGIAIYLSLKHNDNVNNPNSNNPNSGSNPSQGEDKPDDVEAHNLENEAEYYGVQNALNNYYLYLQNGDSQKLWDILEENYKNENNITVNNVLNYLDRDVANFMAKKIYYKRMNGIYFYFVNGYSYNYTLDGVDNYQEAVNMLVIVKNNHYVIRPLLNNIELKSLADNYQSNNINVSDKYLFERKSIDVNNKLESYIAEFLNLLNLDINRAYSMLNEDMKIKYPSVADLRKDKDNILENISSNIFSLATNDKVGYIEYKIRDKRENNITINEYEIMNFKISFEY